VITIFNEILYRPLLNLAVAIYNIVPGHDFGIAVIILTVLVRIVLMPLSIKALVAQKRLNQLGGDVNKLKEKHKEDKTKQSEEIMKLYKEKGVNPLGGCLPLLIQFPLIIALYKVFAAGLKPEALGSLYSFVSKPEAINAISLGIINLAQRSIPLTLLAGGLQFIQAWQQKKNTAPQPTGAGNEMAAISNQMLYFFPLFIIIIGWKLPAGLILYWVTSTAFSIFEQAYIKRKHT
jgi:YidC/Oxa1 family membrane protein insertase